MEIAQNKLTLKNDIVFKAFFARKGNEKYLKSFLEAVLKTKIEVIEVTRRSKFRGAKSKSKKRKTRYKGDNK